MDKKFYVSYEAAKLLKEKGFNKTVDKLIHLNQYKIPIIESPEKYYDESEVYNDYLYLKKSHYACPTKDEAIDWLESKGMCIVVIRRTIDNEVGWCYVIYSQTEIIFGFSTRLEAKDAAIIKALELL